MKDECSIIDGHGAILETLGRPFGGIGRPAPNVARGKQRRSRP